MKQPGLFDNLPTTTGVSANKAILPGVAGSAKKLSKAQQRFNQLISQIAEQRQDLAAWNTYVGTHQSRVNGELMPIHDDMRQAQLKMISLLDRFLDGKELSKPQRKKTLDILLSELDELADEGNEPELIRIYDKYNDVSFAESEQEGLAAMRDMASDVFGIDIDDDEVPLTAEAMAAMLDARLDAAQAAEDEAQSREPPPQKKGNAKARARQAEAEKIAEGASRSIREVYRRLASELHPDREPDAAERARKTELMQRVNVAYEAGDLLALLELQLSIEQINPEALAGMADERIKHYNQVLQEQSNRLSDEIFDITEPFMTMLGKMSTYGVTPESVDRSLNAEINALKKALKAINGDLVRFQDLRVFKADLRYYQINRVDDFDDPFGGPIPDEARKIVQELIAKEMAALVRKQRKK